MRLKEDSSSWRSRGIKRRDYRHDFGTPEVPRHKSNKSKKKKHVHDWQRRVIGTQVVRRSYRWIDGSIRSREYEVDKEQYVCSRCGNKRGHNYWAGW